MEFPPSFQARLSHRDWNLGAAPKRCPTTQLVKDTRFAAASSRQFAESGAGPAPHLITVIFHRLKRMNTHRFSEDVRRLHLHFQAPGQRFCARHEQNMPRARIETL
jgi:hypothetical protein